MRIREVDWRKNYYGIWEMQAEDMHDLKIRYENNEWFEQKDHSTTGNCDVEVVFRNQRDRLLELIDAHPAVVGCVAWLTDTVILDALSTRDLVSIVVQKEDFLRPDSGGSGYYKTLRKAYAALPERSRFLFENHWRPGEEIERDIEAGTEREDYLVGGLSLGAGMTLEPVRCVGNHNADRKPAFPRMHNKFLVFLAETVVEYQVDVYPENKPHGKPIGTRPAKQSIYPPNKEAVVWTGSYNLSNNATRSLENAIILRNNEDIARAYFREWNQIFALSEPLNWESKWVAPEYRIGT